jgi:hypothetical protein
LLPDYGIVRSPSPFLHAAGFPLAAFFVLENPQFCRPIRKRETQSRQIEMPVANLALDCRDLAAAALDSYGDSHSFGLDLLEGPPAVKRCFSTR